MRCSTAQKLISRAVDNDLDEKVQSLLERHLSSCPGCRRILRDLQVIAGSAVHLPDPPASQTTWSKMKTQLNETESLSSLSGPWNRLHAAFLKWRYVPAAAVVVLLAAAAVFLGPRLFNPVESMSALDEQQVALSKLAEAEVHYQLAVKALTEAAAVQGKQLDPRVAAVFKENLEIINASITDCQRAVLNDPADFESRSFLLAAYREKANLLNKWISVGEWSLSKEEGDATL